MSQRAGTEGSSGFVHEYPLGDLGDEDDGLGETIVWRRSISCQSVGSKCVARTRQDGRQSIRPRLGRSACRELNSAAAARERLEATIKDLAESIDRAKSNLGMAVEALGRETAAVESEQPNREPSGKLGLWMGPEKSKELDPDETMRSEGAKDRVGLILANPIERSESKALVATSDVVPTTSVNADTLPESWPSSLKDRWDVEVQNLRGTRVTARLSLQSSSNLGRSDIHREFTGKGSKRSSRFVILPTSCWRTSHDAVSAVLLALDIVIIPGTLAWDIPVVGGLLYASYFMACFWTFDIGVNFLTAFHRKGELICDLPHIARNYTRSWFIADACIVLCDWGSLAILTDPEWRSLRFARALRLLRLASLLRLVKISSVVSQLMDELLPKEVMLAFQFAKCFMTTLALAHLLSCAWFLIGREAPSDTGVRWTDQTSMDGAPAFADETWWYQYSTCLHWSVSSITLGGYVPAEPHSTLERVYSSICLVLGLLFGGALISILSTTMMETNMAKRESSKKMDEVQRYLRERKVDRSMTIRVNQQLTERLATKGKLKDDQVAGLTELAPSLRAELSLHVFQGALKSHALFNFWMLVDETLTQRLCRRCFGLVHLRKQDDLFTAGKSADSAFALMSGSLSYFQEPETSPMSKPTRREVEPACWLGEAALWCQWTHVGTATAGRNGAEIAELNAPSMQEFMLRHAVVMDITRDFCETFLRRLRAARPPASSWPDDLCVPATSWEDMVLGMELDSQSLIGVSCILREKQRARMKPGTFAKLQEEVVGGESVVMCNAAGEMQRVVSVVALQVENDDGQMLVQLGELGGGEPKAIGQLPGGKQARGELVLDTLERLLEGDLFMLPERIEVERVDQEATWRHSEEYGVRTKCLRNIVAARLDSELGDLPGVIEVPCTWQSEWSRPCELELPARPSGRKSTATSVASLSSKQSSVRHYTNTDLMAVADWTDVLCQRPVFHMGQSAAEGGLFAWMTKEELQVLKGPIGEDVLPGWLSNLAESLEAIVPKEATGDDDDDANLDLASMDDAMSRKGPSKDENSDSF